MFLHGLGVRGGQAAVLGELPGQVAGGYVVADCPQGRAVVLLEVFERGAAAGLSEQERVFDSLLLFLLLLSCLMGGGGVTGEQVGG